VTLARVADLTEAEHAEVRVLREAVYPPGAFENWPGRHVEWSSPDWCVRVRDASDVLVSFIGVYRRAALCDGSPVLIGGIGNVKTHPAARGRGFARLSIRRTLEFFGEEPAVDFALLVCEAPLIDYYSRLGWRLFSGRLLVTQHGEPTEFTLNRAMTFPIGSDPPSTGTIDLAGPPW
jgi:hypothetical protein